MFTSLGVNWELSATATILTRVITLWFRFFVSFIAQQILQHKPFLGNKESDNSGKLLPLTSTK
jgi:hypothetical protein